MDFRENGQGHESHGISILGPNILCCLKTGSILLVIEQKFTPKVWIFTISFSSHENFKLLMEKSLNFIAHFSV